MFITVGDMEYELSTKLGTAKKLEKKFNQSLGQIFHRLDEANVNELISIIALAADRPGDADFLKAIEESWDYIDLMGEVSRLIANLMFSGTPEQQEAKVGKYPATEEQKNVIRGQLGIPIPEAPLIGEI